MFGQFDEWLCKTNFSFLQGASHPRDLIETANRLGYRSLCINDFDGVYGLARCYRELAYLKQQGSHLGLKLNYGAEVHFEIDHDLPVLLQDTLVLVALDHRGERPRCEVPDPAVGHHQDGVERRFGRLG